MAAPQFFERDLRLATAGLAPDAINAALAKFAKQELAKVIAEGIAPPRYDRYVNGVEGLPEEAVKAPGPIVYQFSNWPLVINAALDELRKRAPRKSGRYQDSFIVIVGGRVVTDFSTIAADSEVIIVNYQPYTRRLDASRTSSRRHFQRAYFALHRRFGEVFTITNTYLNISGGVHPMIPYVLRRGGGRKGSEIGQPISYPAIIIKAAN